MPNLRIATWNINSLRLRIGLLERLIGGTVSDGEPRPPLAIGFDSRTRGFVPNEIIARWKRLCLRTDLDLTTLFLDCSGAELERRYNETRERLFEMERQGRAYLFVPESMPVSNGERSVAKLAAAHELGLAQVRREMPAIREFLGL